MGFFNKVLGVIGFQSTEAPKPRKKEKASVSTKASYNLKKKEVVEKIDNIDGIKVYYPEEFSEAKNLFDVFKLGDPIIINFDYAKEIDSEKIKAYFMGISDALDMKFLSINGEHMYILLPEGVEIEG